ncbi:hypothetical protein LUZ62_060627 [Rhynchospora pubera]|uniref:Uncharacterized protein n=1 Tax=Rhynchospora pubera TaxID=906938 RepID=A0AAV8E9X2_9POAL|nr:hypothetical protein LUZ62_060627 [Rhynchospora pubera]
MKIPEIEYWEKLKAIEGQIRGFYNPSIPKNFKTSDLLEMVFVDSAFLIELCREFSQGIRLPIIPHPVMKSLKRDLLMVENQVPYIALLEIFLLQEGNSFQSTIKLANLVLKFFGIPEDEVTHSNETPHHMLHLYYNVLASPNPNTSQDNTVLPHMRSTTMIPSASQLHDHGIEFHKNPEMSSIMKVSLKRTGFVKTNLSLPFLRMDSLKRTALANMIYFEEMRNGPMPISSLCCLFNCLMRNEADVLILAKNEIVENKIGGDKELVQTSEWGMLVIMHEWRRYESSLTAEQFPVLILVK